MAKHAKPSFLCLRDSHMPTRLPQLQQVVADAPQIPLEGNVLQSSKHELPQPSPELDLAEDRLDDAFTLGAGLASLLRLR